MPWVRSRSSPSSSRPSSSAGAALLLPPVNFFFSFPQIPRSSRMGTSKPKARASTLDFYESSRAAREVRSSETASAAGTGIAWTLELLKMRALMSVRVVAKRIFEDFLEWEVKLRCVDDDVGPAY